MILYHRDYETRSAADLKKTGASRYMQHPTTSIWCMSYCVGDEPVKLWHPSDPAPAEALATAATDDAQAWAHNNAFEALVERHLAPRYGLPVFEQRKQRCTMVGAYAMGLPGSLDQLAPAIGIDQRKDAAGGRLMLQLARPRKVELAAGFAEIPWDCVRVQEMDADGWEVYETRTGRHVARVQWWNMPEKLARLDAYCAQDTEVERAVGHRLRPLKPSELDLWHLDQQINQRGVCVDRDLANAAKRIVKTAAERLDKQMAEITNFAVTRCSNRNQLIAWIRDQGLDAESVAKDQVEELLVRNDLSPDVRKVLKIRQQSARASVAKIDALLNGTDEDGRARGLLQFYAAFSGRWGGRRFQPQNIRRPDLADVESAIDVVSTGDIDLVDMLYDDPLSVVADTLRGMIKAPAGMKIVAADYSNIEGRVLAWLAGEEWKCQAFRDFDTILGHDAKGEPIRKGRDLYLLTAEGILNLAPGTLHKKSPERQSHGKVPELALGFGGGVGAFASMAVIYNVHLPEDEIVEIRDGWRAKHPRIKQFWHDLESAAIAATSAPGTAHKVGDKIAFKRVGSFLFMQLPSKRFLAYPYPEISSREMPWLDRNGSPVWKDQLSFMGVNSYTRKWERSFTYGGELSNHATQSTARDVLAAAMPRLEAAGYPIVLSVHDELVCEVPEDHGSAEEMERIMSDLPAWATGLPVAAEGFEAERYRK